MLKKIVGKIWRKTPSALRLKIIRATQPKFTASVAAIITNSGEKVLLLEHLLRPQASGWGIPGGFIEHSEQPADAIRREIREETGLELENLQMFRVRTVNRHIEILFRAESFGMAEIKSREIMAIGWFEIDAMPPEMSNVQKSLVKEVLDANFAPPA